MESFRDSPLGQLIRYATSNKYLQYPEERPGFVVPIIEPEDVEKARTERPQSASDGSSSSSKNGDEAPQPDDIASDLEKQHSDALALPHISSASSEQAGETGDRNNSLIRQKTVDGNIVVGWYGPDDPENPHNWSLRRKISVTMVLQVYTLVVYAASSIYTPSTTYVMEEFGVSQIKATLGLSMYVLGYGVGPLLWSPLSELPRLGRNIPYITTFTMFVILSVPTALTPTYGGLLATRFLTGFFGSPCLATGGGTLQDIYSLMKLPYGLSAWVAAAFGAPALGPLLSGFSVPVKGWRWSLWEILWMAGPVLVLMYVAFPETSASNILLRRAERLRKLTGNDKYKSQTEIDEAEHSAGNILRDSLLKPGEIGIEDPAMLFVNLYTAYVYAIFYSFFESFPRVYIPIYGFSLGTMGVAFLVIIVGCLLGAVVYCSYVYWYLEPDIRKNGPRPQEHRMVPAIFGTILQTIGLFIFAWVSRKDIHWIVGLVGLAINGIGSFILFQCIFMYLLLTYPKHYASLLAANDFSRSSLAAGAVLFAQPLFDNLGISKGVSLLAGLSVGGTIGIVAIWYYGASWRAKSRFAEKEVFSLERLMSKH